MRGPALGLLAFMLLAAPAAAQRGLAAYRVDVAGSTVRLDFHGDKATGCERRGLCDTSGTVTVTLGNDDHVGSGLVATSGGSVFGTVFATLDGLVRAVVHTTGSTDCTDDASVGLKTFT